jgi:hypothetical protein
LTFRGELPLREASPRILAASCGARVLSVGEVETELRVALKVPRAVELPVYLLRPTLL